MLLFVAYSSFSPEVKAQLQWVLQDCQVSPRFFISLSLTTKTLRLHTFFISYFWGKEILPEHFKQDYILWKQKAVSEIVKNRHAVGEAECAGVDLLSGILRKTAVDVECE